MCSIFGRIALSPHPTTLPARLVSTAQLRGRDSWGVVTDSGFALREVGVELAPLTAHGPLRAARFVIGNCRAEPTTEYVEEKSDDDIQPFVEGDLVVAHNGTIANDKALMEAHGLAVDDVSAGSKVDTARWARVAALRVREPRDVLTLLSETVGSYGIAVGSLSQGWVVLATNYKPVWMRYVREGGEVALEFTSVAPRSTRTPFLAVLDEGWAMLPPYSALIVQRDAQGAATLEHVSLREVPQSPYATLPAPRALVVCSGGLDSVTAATLVAKSMPLDILHITYGARAQEREVAAVEAIAQRQGWGLRMLDLTEVFRAIGHSRLTGSWEGAAAGEEGAEYAIEWVPARNTILLSAALGIAEGHGYSHLVLGNNIEESGAYPDNEQEFIGRFNDLIPFAVADGVKVEILEPVGGMTKREIVELGLALDAPLDLTWSCYDAGALHCGQCGPCYMRRVAFAMQGATDPLRYLNDGEA